MANVKSSEVGERVRTAIQSGKYRPEIIGERTIKKDTKGIFVQYNKKKYRNIVWSGNTLIIKA